LCTKNYENPSIFVKVTAKISLAIFSGHGVELHTRHYPACKLWLRYGDVGGLGE